MPGLDTLSNPFDPAEPPVLLSVSDLNRQARILLESHFDFVWVEGEISNFVCPSSGHWYFSLKDGDAQVRCAMFKGRNQRVRFRPGNGDAIRLRARVSLYEGRGEFQLIVEHMEHAGAGALQAAFEKLKSRLLKEGLFDQARKRPLPDAASHLGVITSPTGAAIHDILTVLARRCPAIQVSILPVAVQGDGAASEIAQAIERANRWQREGKVDLDALIVGRGGGSLEDLWAFNEEIVARAIAASELPVVSAVGHEVDFSIADMVADHRAPTPSAAAELLSPDQAEWLAQLARQQRKLGSLLLGRIDRARSELRHLSARLKHPGARLREQAQRLDDLEQRLLRAQNAAVRDKRTRLELLASRLAARSPRTRLTQSRSELSRFEQRLQGAMQGKLARARDRLSHVDQLLASLSPQRTLDRGYAIVTDASGRLLRDSQEIAVGAAVQARLARGRLDLTVTRRDDEGEKGRDETP